MRKKTNTPSIILRSPTKDEIIAAGLEPSDSQIAQVRILSKVLRDFGLVSKVYRSKQTVVTKDNRKDMKKNKGIFMTFLKTFEDNESIENVRNVLNLHSLSNLTLEDYLNVINSTLNLNSKEELLQNLTIAYKKAYRITEPTESEVKQLNTVWSTFSTIVSNAKSNGHTTPTLKKCLTYAHHVNEVMAQPDMKGAIDIVYKNASIHTVYDLHDDILDYIDKNSRDGVKQHSNTVIHFEAKAAQDRLEEKIKMAGISGGLTPSNVFDYFKACETDRIEYFHDVYGLDVDNISFIDWEDVAKFFYSPENLDLIDNKLLGTQNRARAIGDNRKSMTTRDLVTVKQRKANLEKKINGKNDPENFKKRIQNLEGKLEAKESEYKDAIAIRDKVLQDLTEAQESDNKALIKELNNSYRQAKELAAKIGRSAAQIRHTLKVTQANKGDAVKQSDIEKLKALETKEQVLLDKAKNSLDGTIDIREFERQYEKKNDIFDFDKEINYRTFSFIVNTVDKVLIDYIVNTLVQGFNLVSEKHGDQYFNIDACIPEESELSKTCTEVFVDYPAESKIFHLFKKNPNLGHQMIDSLLNGIKEQYGVKVQVIDDEEHIKVNSTF